MNKLKKWIIAATADELRELAALADTSVKHLQHLGYEYKEPSADLAGRIATGAERIRKRSIKTRLRLPELTRADLCAACAACAYARRCLRAEKMNRRLSQKGRQPNASSEPTR